MKRFTFLDFFYISRPISFLFLFLCFLVGLIFSLDVIFLKDIVFIILISLLTPFFIFSVNDYYDYESDILNKRKRDWIQGKINFNIKSFKKEINLINLIIFHILFLYTLIFYNLVTLLILVLLLFFLYFYSAPPLRFKEIVFFDSLSNSIIILLYFLLIYSINNYIFSLPISVIAVALSTSSYHLLGSYLDYKSDKKANQKTTSTVIKNKHILFLLSILYNSLLFFVSFNSSFKYLVYFNILLSIIVFYTTLKSKKYLLYFFICFWFLLLISYLIYKFI